MRENIRCPLKEIPVAGMAKIQITGDFEMCCIGYPCEKYPCEEVEKV